MTIHLHANVAAPFGVKHREQLDNNKKIEKEPPVLKTAPEKVLVEDDALSHREQVVKRHDSSSTQYSSDLEEPFASQIEWAYQQANLIGVALRGQDSSFAHTRDAYTLDLNVPGAADDANGFTALYPDGFATYSGKLAQYIYQHIGGVFEPRTFNGAQLVGVDEIV